MTLIEKYNAAKTYLTKERVQQKFFQYHEDGMYDGVQLNRKLLNYTNTFLPRRMWINMCMEDPDLADMLGTAGLTICTRLSDNLLKEIIDEHTDWPRYSNDNICALYTHQWS